MQLNSIKRLISDISRIVSLRKRCEKVGGEFFEDFGHLKSYIRFKYTGYG